VPLHLNVIQYNPRYLYFKLHDYSLTIIFYVYVPNRGLTLLEDRFYLENLVHICKLVDVSNAFALQKNITNGRVF